MNDLGTVLNNLSTAFPLIVQLIFILMGLFGLLVGYGGLKDLYAIASDPYHARGGVGHGEAIGKIVLGAALMVAPVILWQSANTFVLGGQQTANLLSYVPTRADGYCKQVHFSISAFLMIVGASGLFHAAAIMWGMANGTRNVGTGQAITYFVGGTLCFFINDAAKIIGNTIGFGVGFDQLCQIM
ncbi:hypothetical protein [Microvirga puerhi]|uniref:Uncharacterized protein n=1 Tax=Microvirga puerhi TaxID=2876078 RepID=A0ABS7VUS6_9HYPH|nr:hypothetical protein [Microvirga puerhi]MBZ6078901.1 hypothetical protein [Microvirga puerhi]